MSFNLQPHLEQIYENESRQKAFTGSSSEDFLSWQKSSRTTLRKLLCLKEDPSAPVDSKLIKSAGREGYEEQQWSLSTESGVDINCYLLIPETKPPYVPVLVFHGHDPSIQYCLGNFPDEETAGRITAEYGNYAQALAQSGHLVCAVEQRGFGERITEGGAQSPGRPWTDRHLFFSYLLQGRVLQGERVRDGLTVLEWLLQRTDIHSENLVCTGQSGGGSTAIYLSALEERISIVVPGSSFSSYKESILNTEFGHCECNYIPGILSHFESGDVVSLIAPRPLCIISGEEDKIFPVEPARDQFSIVMKAYTALNVKEKCKHYIHKKQHMYHIPACEEWIKRWAEHH